MTEGPVDLNIH